MHQSSRFLLILLLLLLFNPVISLSDMKPLLLASSERALEPEDESTSKRAEIFFIGSGQEDYPIFTKKVMVDPFKAKEGEEQAFSIWAKDPDGIEKVTAKIITDKEEEEVIELNLIEETIIEGRLQGFWITKNISNNPSYITEFKAVNKKGKSTTLTLSWQSQAFGFHP